MTRACPRCGKTCRRVSQHIRWAHSPQTSSKPFNLFTKGGSRITVVSRVAPGEVDAAYTCPGMGCMRRFKFHVALWVSHSSVGTGDRGALCSRERVGALEGRVLEWVAGRGGARV